ncbi:uncharacterized protein LOC110814104 isoform X2 [Carica papaya]|nr:uncharacterized protein LOC110814104 isoform X2 [Carica papaya]
MEITIRPFKISDIDDFMVYGCDERVARLTRWNAFNSKEEALTFLKDFCIPQPFFRSICIDDHSIGYVFVMRGSTEYEKYKAVLGYAVAAEYWGKGIATTAAKMTVRQAFKEFPDLVRLEAFTAVENEASQKVLEKLGFTKEGVLRKYVYIKGANVDSTIFSLLSTDPMP